MVEPDDTGKFAANHRIAIADPIFKYIDEQFKKLADFTGTGIRQDQVRLSKEICKSLVSNVPLIAEAPTGTGKTIAYLIGAIAASEKLSLKKRMPIVIATATVGLQTQVLFGDIPKLVGAGVIPEGAGILAKGRSRYFCIKSATKISENESDDGSQLDIFDGSANINVDARLEANRLLNIWMSGTWPAGDIDTVPGATPIYWGKVAADASTCIGHKCDYYSNCPFFNARKLMGDASLIIANQDLVLSDLAMDKDGIDPLFPESRYLSVFDEAHNLPDKAIQAGSSSIRPHEALDQIPVISQLSKTLGRISDVVKFLDSKKINLDDLDSNGLKGGLELLNDDLGKLGLSEENSVIRFPKGVVPDEIKSSTEMVRTHSNIIYNTISEISQALKSSDLPDKNPVLGSIFSELLGQISGVLSVLADIVKGANQLLSNEKVVRWAQVFENKYSVHNSPAEGSEVLRDLLWNSERTNTALVSATLSDLDNSFERFKSKIGAPDYVTELKLPHSFPYHFNDLFIVNMKHLPKYESMPEYLVELAECLKLAINEDEGSLVLFKSVEAMKVVVPLIKEKFGDLVLVQRSAPLKQLISNHKDRIDNNQGSVLCGVATMAEGLDLPGDYCTHVLICGIPFNSPSSPVEQEAQEEMGADYFEKRTLPDALLKLIQMVGRLMRRDTDRGRVTIFDTRLYGFKYGQKLRAALPDFNKRLVNVSQLEKMVKNWKKL